MHAFNILVRAGTMLAVLAGTPPAEAEPARPCADRAEVVARLAERFGEPLRSVARSRDDAVPYESHTDSIRFPYSANRRKPLLLLPLTSSTNSSAGFWPIRQGNSIQRS